MDKTNSSFDFLDPLPCRDDLERVIDRTLHGYPQMVCRCALNIAAKRPEFTAEDVRQWCQPDPGQENTFSSAMLTAKRLGIIKVARYVNAKRTEAKGRMIPVYCKAFR